MKNNSQRLRRVAIATIITAASGAVSASAAPIAVMVNGNPVNFGGTNPMEVQGSVLVPLRGVFEALGAVVNYNGATHTINAEKGSSTIILPIGSQTAVVNGQPESLSQPAQVVAGSTLVPLRFVAEALGAYVDWVPQTQTVEIKTDESHVANLPTPSGSGNVTGQVTGVYTLSSPNRITVRVNGQNTVVPLSDNTIILRSTPNQPGVQSPLSAINPGDQVTIQRDDNGVAQIITATYGEIKGTIKTIGRLASGDSAITLNDGSTIELLKNAPITMDKRRIKLSDVMANEQVVIRTNPNNSLGYGLAVVTGNNANPKPPVAANPVTANAQVSIDSFTDNATSALRAGDTIQTNLAGTPGAHATFSIPGVVNNVAMTETSPGNYQGAYIIPKNVSVNGAAVLAKLSLGGSVLLAQASNKIVVDSVPPKIADLSPAPRGTTATDRPLIYGTFSDGAGTGVDPHSVKITLDGADITQDATVTSAFFNVTPQQPLSQGSHTLAVMVMDNAGNQSDRTWTFTVANTQTVKSFTSSAPADQAVAANTNIRFTLNAAPGGKADFSIGSMAKNVPMQETSPGVYVGTYTAAQGDNIKNAPVTAHFTSSTGQSVTTTLASGLTIAAGAPNAPVITSPTENSTVTDTLTVQGTSSPNVTVRVNVTYISKQLGGLVSLDGAVGSKDVTADNNGHWAVTDMPLQTNSLFGFNRDTTFTVTAIAIAPSGEQSPATTVKVRHG